MPPSPIVDFSRIDMEAVRFTQGEILETIPHRHEIVQVDWITAFDPEEGYSVGVKEVGEDEFWVRGHIPGRPILPGVLLIEAAAQLATFHFRKAVGIRPESFFGLARVDGVRFRGVAEPGDRVVLAVKLLKYNTRAAVFAAQAFVEGRLIFEAELMGSLV